MGVELGKLKRLWEIVSDDENLECDEPPLGRQKVLPSCGPLADFPHGKKTTKFPEWFKVEDGRCFFGTSIWASGAKGVVRKYESPDGFNAMAKAHCDSDEYELEAAISRRSRGVPGLMRSWTIADEPFLFGQWVDTTLHGMHDADFDRLAALRDVLGLVRRLNTALAPNVGAYLDVTATNVGYCTEAKTWIMVDLGGVYLRGWGSEVVTPSYVPPFMWKRNSAGGTRDRFEIVASEFTLEELRLVGAYAVVATFGTLMIGPKRTRTTAFTLHSTYMRKHLSCNRGNSAKVFQRFLDAVSTSEATAVARAVRKALEVFLNEDASISAMRAACEEIVKGDAVVEASLIRDDRNN